MKYFFNLLFCVLFASTNAQKVNFDVKKIKLPSEIEFYDNQFSGLFIANNSLLLLSESRLQDNAEPKLYALQLLDIESNIKDTNYVLPYKKIVIKNLEMLRQKMKAKGDDYEGLEAITINKNIAYISVETATPSNNCYLLRGIIKDSIVDMDIKFLLPTPKPIDNKGNHIYNAGYEAITYIDDAIVNIFEYNFFKTKKNEAISIFSTKKNIVVYQKNAVSAIPFRITDITKTEKKSFTAINYFYKGEGKDEVYRVPTTDTKNDILTRDKNGYKSYSRLITLEYKKNKFSWKPLWDFPKEYMAYNWEGIAAYKKGYFVINDKYTPARPYSTVLLYLSPIKK